MEDEDKNHRSDNNLIKHLKNADFFDVKKFPFSTIAISRVESINVEDKEITGNLTIKGITHPVSLPAKVEVKDGIVKANGKLVIDRTLWDVRYKSGKFFDNLKDQAIADSGRSGKKSRRPIRSISRIIHSLQVRLSIFPLKTIISSGAGQRASPGDRVLP
jgi:hypothetical protein